MALLALGAAPAGADVPIEGVWSFNGGKVAIEAQPDGTLAGTVVDPITFDECEHPAGEQMWKQMSRQSDGSYLGLHQWIFESTPCIRNPQLGATAWRVLEKHPHKRFLRVCFSEPGSGLQPTIARDGTPADASWGCTDSELISKLPTIKGFWHYVWMPDDDDCISRDEMRIFIRHPHHDPFEKIAVELHSGNLEREADVDYTPSGAIATLNLRHLHRWTFAVKVRLRTVLGNRLKGERTYALCKGSHRHHHDGGHHGGWHEHHGNGRYGG